MPSLSSLLSRRSLLILAASLPLWAPPAVAAELFDPSTVRITEGPFADAIRANRDYLLKHDVDRLLAPFRREAGLPPKAASYGDWEAIGLDGHTAGHYLSALAGMIAEGGDNDQRDLARRLDLIIDELAACQEAAGDGYLGGVPKGHALWKDILAGKLDANGFGLNNRWVPWYNLHKTFAGLRDAHLVAHHAKAGLVFRRYGEWCLNLLEHLSDDQVQQMLRAEHGGMAEVLADLFALTGDVRYRTASARFTHHAIVDPLYRREDRLTGLHANTQIPKIIGLQRLGALTRDQPAQEAAAFFWETVTRRRSVAFGGNSVSEHFNDTANFGPMLAHREGPETCNTYNMLRLTEQLFESYPKSEYADYYERALFNHILPSFNTREPGFVYFTPIRPGHYRVYSTAGVNFWCCVGSGMENPGRYGRFIYARDGADVFVNLFLPSELRDEARGLRLRQETRFPAEPRTVLRIDPDKPTRFALRVRHPAWVPAGGLGLRVNGTPFSDGSAPGSYAVLDREWRAGDVVEVETPFSLRLEGLPDGSAWHAFLYGPVVLAAPVDRGDPVVGRAGEGRSAHIARGALLPLDQMPVLVGEPAALLAGVAPDASAGPLHFRLKEGVSPAAAEGLPLVPFSELQDRRYQMYWEITTPAGLEARRVRLAAEEQARAAREAATLDFVAVGEQQPEVDHEFSGEEVDSGEFQGRRWRHGRAFQYALVRRGESAPVLSVTFSGTDRDRVFEILANGKSVAEVRLTGEKPGEFIERRFTLPPAALQGHGDKVVIRFVGRNGSLAGGVYDVRLLRPGAP